jgi:hypothetical protein
LKSTIPEIVTKAVLSTHRALFTTTEVLKTLISLSTNSQLKLVRNLAAMAVKTWIKKHAHLPAQTFPSHIKVPSDDFPYNKSWSGDMSFGGADVGVDFSASVFAGTNFDCNHPTFNYEAYAKADVDVSLFGHSANAVDAGVIYGRENGQPLQGSLNNCFVFLFVCFMIIFKRDYYKIEIFG